MELPNRKSTRLKHYDYSKAGAYFITICTKDRDEILSEIVGMPPQVVLSEYGLIADKYIHALNDFYDNLSVLNYVIMPNHIHFLIRICKSSSSPAATIQNSAISQFVSTFKRFCNKEYGKNIWQYRSNDHIVRDEQDYYVISEYISNNPKVWYKDKFHR